MKLSELVSSALEGAQAKIASVVDAEREKEAMSPGEMARTAKTVAAERLKGKGRELAHAAGGAVAGAAVGAGTMHGIHKHQEEEKKASVISTATEAVKFAESLEHLAMLLPKIAEGGSTSVVDRAGPEVFVSPTKGTTKDTSTKAKTLSAQEASSGGGTSKGMATETFVSKAAAEAMLSAKIAQSEALLAVGRANEAAALAKEAKLEFEAAKKAYDEDAKTPKGSPQSLAVNRKPGDFPVPGRVPDNQGAIDMTKRQAKTDDVRREAGKHIAEPALSAATDKGLTDNLDHTEGAKIARINNILKTAQARKAGAATAN